MVRHVHRPGANIFGINVPTYALWFLGGAAAALYLARPKRRRRRAASRA